MMESIMLKVNPVSDSSLLNDIQNLDKLVLGDFNLKIIILFILCILAVYTGLIFMKEILYTQREKLDFHAVVKEVLPELTVFIFSIGVILYYIGYDYAGTGGCWFTLLMRSVLSAFEMFLSKSGIIGIAANCKANTYYMFLYVSIHNIAVCISMIFAITCFGKRVLDQLRGWIWPFILSNRELHVFWGMDERNVLLAKDVYRKNRNKAKIVFIDFPSVDSENSNGKSFSGLMGLLSYKTNKIKQVSDIKYILLRSSVHPSTVIEQNVNILQYMGIRKLNRFIDKSGRVFCYIFTDDESANTHLALNLLNNGIAGKIDRIFCYRRKTKAAQILEQCQTGKRLQLVDDSREAIAELAGHRNERGEYTAHPINYVTVNSDGGYIEDAHPFTALIVGFGTTGKEAFKFLYEFSALPNKSGAKSKVEFTVCDGDIEKIKGDLIQEIPVLPELEKLNEVRLCACHAGSEDFYMRLSEMIERLNYVVIATGDDSTNLHIATMIYEFAIQHRKDDLEKFRIFVRIYKSENEYKFKRTIQNYNHMYKGVMEYFGAPRLIYTYDQIVNRREEEEAYKFYAAYCDVAGDEKIKNNWERQSRELGKQKYGLLGYRSYERKLSQDKANFKHTYTKNILLGLDRYDVLPVVPEWPFGKADSKEEKDWYQRLTNASICEHLRWNAAHLMMGYTSMTTDESNKLNGATCNERTKQHLCLVDWEQLPGLCGGENHLQEYDYNVVKTTIAIYNENKG